MKVSTGALARTRHAQHLTGNFRVWRAKNYHFGPFYTILSHFWPFWMCTFSKMMGNFKILAKALVNTSTSLLLCLKSYKKKVHQHRLLKTSSHLKSATQVWFVAFCTLQVHCNTTAHLAPHLNIYMSVICSSLGIFEIRSLSVHHIFCIHHVSKLTHHNHNAQCYQTRGLGARLGYFWLPRCSQQSLTATLLLLTVWPRNVLNRAPLWKNCQFPVNSGGFWTFSTSMSRFIVNW